MVPDAASVLSSVIAAPGTAWLADPAGSFVAEDVTSTVLVDGILALVGTVKFAVNAPTLSGVAEAVVVPAYFIVTDVLAGNPEPVTVTVLPRRLEVGSKVTDLAGLVRVAWPVRPAASVTVRV